MKLLLVVITLVFAIAGSPAFAGDPAYVSRYDSDSSAKLVQFDVETDAAVMLAEIPADNSYKYFTVDEGGGCLISKFMTYSSVGRDIYHLEKNAGKISHYMGLNDSFGPGKILTVSQELVAEIFGDNENPKNGGILFIDRRNKRILNKIIVRPGDPELSQLDIDAMIPLGKNLIALTTSSLFRGTPKQHDGYAGFGEIIIIDTTARRVKKVISVAKGYYPIDGMAASGDKIYITALTKGRSNKEGNSSENCDVLVYSLATSKLLKKIRTSPSPLKLVHDKSVNKIYVQHMTGNIVEVVDTIKDKVIKRLRIPYQAMLSVVAPGKIYATKGMYSCSGDNEPALLVIDTIADKIIKTIPGNFRDISINPKY